MLPMSRRAGASDWLRKSSSHLAPLRERMEGDAPESLEEDLNFGYYKDDEIDFDEIVLDQVILQVPFKPLCRDQCRGLCPNCGMNLNTGSCSCRKQTGHAGFREPQKFRRPEVKLRAGTHADIGTDARCGFLKKSILRKKGRYASCQIQ